METVTWNYSTVIDLYLIVLNICRQCYPYWFVFSSWPLGAISFWLPFILPSLSFVIPSLPFLPVYLPDFLSLLLFVKLLYLV